MELNNQYLLTNETIDAVSEQACAFLEELKTEPKNLLRLRLVIEEILLDWQEHFSNQAQCRVKMGKHFGRPFIQLEVEGESWMPSSRNAEDFGSYRERLLASMGLWPIYSYENGRNRVLFKLKKQSANPLVTLALAITLGIVTGAAGLWVLPEAVRGAVLERFLTPVYDTFFNLLGTIAGPMVFLSVAWGIYGIGDTATFGRIGKRMILHFLAVFFSICTLAVVACLPFFHLKFMVQSGGASQLDSLFRMVLGFIPTDIVSPFQDGNSMQIILLGASVGCALLALGKQTEAAAQVIEQVDYIVQYLMEIISRLVPGFIFIVLVQMVWSGTLNVVLSAWKPLLVFVVLALACGAGMTLWAAVCGGVSPVLLFKKGLPTGIVSLTTASSVAGFGSCTTTCEKKLGVSSQITSFGVPLGVVMFPPATAIYFLITCLYTAERYGVACSPAWFVLAVFSVGVLSIASPPIPGGTLTCYTILFTQLGLPEEALVVALALDVLCDFLATGVNMYSLQMELLLQGKKLGMLNTTILRKKS